MRQAGHGDAGDLSPAQLTAAFKFLRRERALRDLRALMIAAAGAAGGKAFKHMAATIQAEVKMMEDGGSRVVEEEPKSEMPLSAADFEAMMKEANA